MIEDRLHVPVKPLNGPDLLIELSKVRKKLAPELRVFADALAYVIVGVDHLILHAHDDEETEN